MVDGLSLLQATRVETGAVVFQGGVDQVVALFMLLVAVIWDMEWIRQLG
ncbi:MAG: hypothetical protein HQL72_05865 [Magnetococcales bacterium]|nr:hypothetical protein [Magnetococcales bacterium]